jgi:hypothetical protein
MKEPHEAQSASLGLTGNSMMKNAVSIRRLQPTQQLKNLRSHFLKVSVVKNVVSNVLSDPETINEIE